MRMVSGCSGGVVVIFGGLVDRYVSAALASVVSLGDCLILAG